VIQMPGAPHADDRQHARLAWGIWFVLLAGVATMAALAPERRTVFPVYAGACRRFWDGIDLYGGGIHGFLYLPFNAWAVSPFLALGRPVADVLWRIVSLGLLAFGVRRLARHQASRQRAGRADRIFLLATLLALPATWSAARNGQANLLLIALVIHAALDVAAARPGRAALGLVLAMAAKPIAIVPLLLFGALDAPLRGRLLVGLALIFALPLLHPDPGYVLAQYGDAMAMLRRAAQPGTPYTEAFGGLEMLGLPVAATWRTAARLLAAVLTLVLAHRAWRREGRVGGAVTTLGLAVVYLMAFNPRTEANAYVMLGAVAAPAAAGAWLSGRRVVGACLALGCLLLGTHLIGGALHHVTRRWLKPLLALAFGAWISLRGRARGVDAAPAADRPGAPRPAAG